MVVVVKWLEFNSHPPKPLPHRVRRGTTQATTPPTLGTRTQWYGVTGLLSATCALMSFDCTVLERGLLQTTLPFVLMGREN